MLNRQRVEVSGGGGYFMMNGSKAEAVRHVVAAAASGAGAVAGDLVVIDATAEQPIGRLLDAVLPRRPPTPTDHRSPTTDRTTTKHQYHRTKARTDAPTQQGTHTDRHTSPARKGEL
jgi:hypothetical protein